jgi:hypothetical protein
VLSADNPFYRQVVLLVELLPLVASERRGYFTPAAIFHLQCWFETRNRCQMVAREALTLTDHEFLPNEFLIF